MSARSAIVLALIGAAACSSDPPQMMNVPTPETVRTVYGLGDGSCWKYRFSQAGTPLFASVTLAGPNSTAIAGHDVWVRKFQLESGGLPTEDYLEVTSLAEVRLLRHVEGQGMDRVTKRYDEDPAPPLFARFRLDRTAGASMNEGDSFATTPTPADMPVESHRWTVLSKNDPVSTPSGEATSYKLSYVRDTATAVYNLVPGFGFAKIVDFGGTTYQACAARVCDAAGTCTGAPSCQPADLVCQ